VTDAPAVQPWDTAEIASDALDILRLQPEDPDADRVVDAAVVACALVDQELDTAEPMDPIPAPVNYAAVLVTIELYRRKDAPFGVLNAWSVDDVLIRLSADTLRSVRRLLLPFKQRFGVA
jgi:hypothetical protein